MSASYTAGRRGSSDPFTVEPGALSAVLARNWWAVALRGVFAILFGIIAFVVPGATMLSLVLVFAAYMLVDGIFAIISAVRAARHGVRWDRSHSKVSSTSLRASLRLSGQGSRYSPL